MGGPKDSSVTSATAPMAFRSSIDDGPSPPASEYDYSSDEELELAEKEWNESVQQLQLLVSVVLLPMLGKYLGRRFSHFGICSLFSIPFATGPENSHSVCKISEIRTGMVILFWRETVSYWFCCE